MPYGFTQQAWNRIDPSTQSNILRSQNGNAAPTVNTTPTITPRDTRQWGDNEIPTGSNGVALPGYSLVVPTTSDRDYSTPIIGGGATKTPELNQIVQPNPEQSSMLSYIQSFTDARASKNPPMYNPGLIKDDSDMDEVIL